MDVDFFFDKNYHSNGFWDPVDKRAVIHLLTLWLNSMNERVGNSEIKLDNLVFFTFRLNETTLHEFLHGMYGLTDPQILRISQWFREFLLYESA